jgi:hypothetical protein
MDFIGENHAASALLASGTAVGLSDGLMGNSEVGYVPPFDSVCHCASMLALLQAFEHWRRTCGVARHSPY